MNETVGPSKQQHLVDLLVNVMPFAYGLLWGVPLAVFLGAIDGSGVALQTYMPVLTAFTGAALGFFGNRWLSLRSAERARHRGGYEDYLRLQTGIRALMTFQDAVASISKKAEPTLKDKILAATPEERSSFIGAIISVSCAGFDDPPTFKDCIETDADHAKAHRIRYYFATADWHFRNLKKHDLFASKLSPVMEDFLSPIARRNIEDFERELLKAGTYFRIKLGVTS